MVDSLVNAIDGSYRVHPILGDAPTLVWAWIDNLQAHGHASVDHAARSAAPIGMHAIVSSPVAAGTNAIGTK